MSLAERQVLAWRDLAVKVAKAQKGGHTNGEDRMSLNATNKNSHESVSKLRFAPNGNGLLVHFESADSAANGFVRRPMPEAGEQRREMSVAVEVSRDHGIITVPVRLPRYLMPEWSQDDWAEFIGSEQGFFHNFVDEAVVQCLSLALVADDDRRKEILRTANEVVIDFRGDLPNKYLAMMLGGYKVGVYRSGNNWPMWLSIQPTYDLALKEAERIRTEAGLPKNKSISAAGALSNFLKADMGLPILSSASAGTGGRWLIAAASVVVMGLFAWLMK
jgi:hypothetical protein